MRSVSLSPTLGRIWVLKASSYLRADGRIATVFGAA
jgi:hypothetical protein